MDAGKLNERIGILALRQTDATYDWEMVGEGWARAEETGKGNLFSRLGLSAPSAEFAVRRYEISPHNAIQWRREQYLVTAIRELDRMYLSVSAARVRFTYCKLWRGETCTDPGTKRTVRREPAMILTFPAVLTEKYSNYRQLEPMGQTEQTLILVTPKPIVLEVADLVELSDSKYAVRVCHTLDEFRNEYEIYRKETGGKEGAPRAEP